jgi:hypothetical protein
MSEVPCLPYLLYLMFFTLRNFRSAVTSVSWNVTLHPEDGGDKFLRNVGNHLQDHMVSQTRRSQSTSNKSVGTTFRYVSGLRRYWLLVIVRKSNKENISHLEETGWLASTPHSFPATSLYNGIPEHVLRYRQDFFEHRYFWINVAQYFLSKSHIRN